MELRAHWNRLADVWEERTVARTGQRTDPYGAVAMDAIPLDDYWSILDIGCGPGVSTIELAERSGPNTTVTGIDIAAQMVLHARNRRHDAIQRGVITPENVTFEVADAERDDLGADHDVVFSRFGLMFFTDAPAAFTNLAASLRHDGWLSFVAWAGTADNPWMPLPAVAAGRILDLELDAPDPSAPGPFSLADPAATTELLTGAGFDRIDVIDITQPMRIGHQTERTWADVSLRIGPAADAYAAAGPDERRAAVDAVVDDLAPYRQTGPTGDWLIPAHARAYVARRR